MKTRAPLLCIGSAMWDIIAHSSRDLRPGFDVPGRIERRMGGVALNIALEFARQGQAVEIMSYIGNDPTGDALVAEIANAGVGTAFLTRGDAPTDTYLAVEDPDGEVFAAIADCAALERTGEGVFAPLRNGLFSSIPDTYSGHIIADGNLPEATLRALLSTPETASATMVFVPASPGKASRLAPVIEAHGGRLYVNRTEAEIILAQGFSSAIDAAEALTEAGADTAIVTDGPRTAAVSTNGQPTISQTPPPTEAHTTTGAGDIFLAAHLSAELNGASPNAALAAAIVASCNHISSLKD
ncbi:PfkB family carbohydrate kinase [Algicella marina]|uniref:Kinase n=1 Tax=Algicella marina TaxID=2683284 RepID=A0A6P1SVJ1_9RHOB|nr:PfkB family carbohydrate kinase [Algicella marina]QHQ34704.1 kinase [Algicella marina]